MDHGAWDPRRTRPSSVEHCIDKVFGDVGAVFLSKSKEPRRNGAMPTFRYYEVLPSHPPRSCCISRRDRRLDLLKRFKHSKATLHYSRIQHLDPALLPEVAPGQSRHILGATQVDRKLYQAWPVEPS